MILETTLATEFTPGTNVKGEVAGANWSFMLPSLELTRVLCVGIPSLAALLALAHFSNEVIIICRDASDTQELSKLEQRYGLKNITSITAGNTHIPLADANVELVLIVERSEARRISRDHAFRRELQRLLNDDGLIYFETGAAVDWVLGGQTMPDLVARFGAPRIFWVTPITGEMQTAIPVGHDGAIAYALYNRIYRRSLDIRIFKHAVQSLSLDKLVGPFAVSQSVRRKRSESNQQKQTNEAESGGRVQAGRQRISRDVSVLVFNRVQAELGNLERFLRLRGLFDRVFQRHSVLFGGQASDLGGAPPRYLRDIAAINGVDISQYHWGLFARGEYSSRKVLFLLFREGEASPEFIVKITRDPALNPRLENENRALVTLAQQGIGDRDTLPRVAFSGEHAGLAIVGETIVDGVPFEQRSNETVDCAYAHAAINWITELGEATADPNTASPLRVAEAMNRLLERFAQIYHLPAAHYEFLSRQTAALTQGYGQFPLVFQHGDPGTWNILVTPTGRIAFLDWEAAELYGMPLWDLFYFVYTYGIWAARTKSAGDRMKGFEQQFLAASPFNILLAEATSRYCARVGLHKEFVEPLYYTCWMHRALKEATRLTQSQLARGHYLNILRASIDQRAALAPLFSLATSR